MTADDSDDLDKAAPDTPAPEPKPPVVEGKEAASGLSATVTVVLSIVVALITSLGAPLVVERLKNSEAKEKLDKQKQDKIVATQFEIVERCNRTFWRYRQAAGYLMFDFEHSPSEELLHRHLKEFEDASAEANRDMPAEAFRARMYFHSIYVSNLLFSVWANIFNGVDNDISNQLLREKSVPHPNDKDSYDAWHAISRKINSSMASSEDAMNEAFELIGQSGIDEKHKNQAPLQLFRIP